VYQAEYPTPSATSYRSSGNGAGNNKASRNRPSLERMAAKGLWPTPTRADAEQAGSRNTGHSKAHAGESLTDAIRGDRGEGRPAAPGVALAPAWTEWLMNWVPGWSGLEPIDKEMFDAWEKVSRVNLGTPALPEDLRGEGVLEVRVEEGSGAAPQGPEPEQQPAVEREDPVQEMPRAAARCRSVEGPEEDEDLLHLPSDVPVQAASGENVLDWMRRQVALGNPTWAEDPADSGCMSRVGVGIPERKNRLKAIGNGQVPLCAAVAFLILMERATNA
jgi:hypothetical protein